MDRRLSIILGSAFILMSGLVFTLERLCVYLRGTELPGTWLADHLISIIFLLLGLSLFTAFMFKKESHYVV